MYERYRRRMVASAAEMYRVLRYCSNSLETPATLAFAMSAPFVTYLKRYSTQEAAAATSTQI